MFCNGPLQSGDLWGGSVGMEWGAGEDVPATFQKKRPCAAALVLNDRSGYPVRHLCSDTTGPGGTAGPHRQSTRVDWL